jgi:RNA polymerase sigma-70 factor, ECF subfamily
LRPVLHYRGMIVLEEVEASVDESIDYVTLRGHLVRAVARVCPHWLADKRDDLVQCALLRVMSILERRWLPGEGSPVVSTSYLYKVAYSVLVDELRKVRRRGETELNDEVVALTGPRDDPERATASREIGRGIRGCLKAMKRERRLAVILHLQGHSVPEAARLLEWAFKRTENLVYRGLADLRACLSSKGMTP